VALAKALTADANFLVLDEPTNHLDMASVNILIQALQQYEGTVIVVSHDRYFLDNVANKIWFIEDQKIKQYPGTYAEYDEWNSKRILEPKAALPTPQPKKEPVKLQPSENKHQQLKKLNQDLAKMEENISALEKQVKDFEAKLADAKIYNDSNKLKETNAAYAQKQAELKQVQQAWEAVAEQIMEMEA
jgi:ATP-binding cassette subfamily F protein 3